MKTLGGVIIPSVTPFDETGAVRLDWLRKNFERWNRTEIRGMMVLGSNGEFRALNDDEAFRVLEAAAGAMAPDKVLIAGAGRESLHGTLAFIRRLEEAALPIDYISVLTPHYFGSKMTDQALEGYYTAVADESPWPVLLYCAPGFANGVCISPDLLRVLSEHPNIAGIKDTSRDMMNDYMDAVGGREDFAVLAGSVGNLLTCMQRGGPGGVLSAANYFPRLCSALAESLASGGPEGPEFYARVKAIAAATGGRAGVAGVKALMNEMGYHGGVPRLPLLPVGKELLVEIRRDMEHMPEIIPDGI